MSFAWTSARTSRNEPALGALPFRIDAKPTAATRRARRGARAWDADIEHGLLDRGRPDAFCLKMAANAGAKSGDMVAFGHTHLPWKREIGHPFREHGHSRPPKDGDWRAGYSVVEFGNRVVTVDHVRVEYDVDKTRHAIEASELPNEFADFLRTGEAVDSLAEGVTDKEATRSSWSLPLQWSITPASSLGLLHHLIYDAAEQSTNVRGFSFGILPR